MQRASIFVALLTSASVVGICPLALAESAPTVFEDYDPAGPVVEYTVTNPSPSTVGDIVAFVIDFSPDDFPYSYWADTANQWKFQDLAPGDWGSAMEHEGGWSPGPFPMTWQEFFGGISYPFGLLPAAGYFVGYSEVSPGVYQFDSPSLAISPGESLDQFFVDGRALSTFYLAHLPDASVDTFGSSDLSSFSGEAVPEPSALVLLGMAAVALLAHARRRRRCG